jgi:hypothetical protein
MVSSEARSAKVGLSLSANELRVSSHPSRTVHARLAAPPKRTSHQTTTTRDAVLTRQRPGPGAVDVIVKCGDERRAPAFERYLKSGSGCAFAQRHCGDAFGTPIRALSGSQRQA